MSTTEQEAVQDIVVRWADAISREDRPAILAHHAEELRMFDFPNEVRGLRAYDETWDFFYREKAKAITFAPSAIETTIGSDVAFVSCNMHCDGTNAGPLDFRLTVGLVKRSGAWVITHEHHSLPTKDGRFIAGQAG